MLRIISIFLVLLGSVFLGIQLHNDPGYVLIGLKHWTLETTLWVALFALLVFFGLLHLILHALFKIIKTPGTLQHWNARRLAHKAQRITRKGLIEYSEGYWDKAKKHLIQAIPNTDMPLLNYLTAARAAQKMGDSQLRDHYLRQAQQAMPEAKIAVELTQAQLQLANEQWEQALATLRHLHDLAPHHPYVLKLLVKLYQHVRDWSQLIALLPALKKHNVLHSRELDDLERQAYLNALQELQKQNQPQEVIAFFNSMPKSLQHHIDLIIPYGHYLLNHRYNSQTETLLRNALRKEFHPRLIELYSHIPANEQQVAFIESLLKKNSHCAPLLLCLAQQAMTKQLWGQAKTYLEQSITVYPSPQAYEALGILDEQLGNPVAACAHYKTGLQLTTQNSFHSPASGQESKDW